jgi:serine/threonine protein phosphatase 1
MLPMEVPLDVPMDVPLDVPLDVPVKLPVEVHDWNPAPFDVKGETVFAVGDVHGCARECRALLDAIADLASGTPGRRRLIYLGDLINRGPDSIGVLEQWAAGEDAHGVDHVDRLMGNHEIMMMLAVIGGPHAQRAETMWLSKRMGGQILLDEMRLQAGTPSAPVGHELLKSALRNTVMHRLYAMRSHVRLGNTLFVHGGLDPHADPDEFLARPWTIFTEARWAWINHGFLDWNGGFGGILVVHGHTPPDKHRAISGMEDPHLFEGDRLGLDGGSARTGVVIAAEIQDGRYRILKAGMPFAAPPSSSED